MKEKLKRLLGIGAPGGIDDVVIRAIKTGVAVLLASPIIVALPTGPIDFDALTAVVVAAGSAAGSVILNAGVAFLNKWVNSP
jgi:hypothetical protein